MKNLLLALGLAILPIQPEVIGTRTYNVSNEPTTKTNIYEETRTENNTLVKATEVATINFDEQIKTNLTYRQRAIITTFRDINANEYSIVYNLYISIDTQLDREEQPTTIQIILDQPQKNAITTQEVTYYSGNSLTTIQNNFFNGENYNSYNELQSIKNQLNANLTEQGNDSGFQDYIMIEMSNYSYMRFEIYIEYNPNRITNSGATLLNNIKTVERNSTQIQYRYSYDTNTYEVIDIPGLMFQILGMPFAWLSLAFNFTIFEGTPYAINISSILMSLLVALIGIIIFRLVMKGR